MRLHETYSLLSTRFFLWHLKIRLGEKAPALTVSQVRRLLEVVLPRKIILLEGGAPVGKADPAA
jgi:hypothetical protein